MDVNNPRIGLKIASERLAIVRYVFLVQVEDGIATADQRACLEYADAVLIGWPEMDADDIADLDEAGRQTVEERLRSMEGYIARFSAKEAEGDVDTMTDLLVRATECVASIRRLYQPDFPIPTYAEIRHVVQDEWDDDMDKIDLKEHDTTVEAIEQETEKADEQRDANETDGSGAGSDGSKADGKAAASDGAPDAKHEGK
ncbi:phosphoribosylglycinamide synthetase [Bifidobacterium sp. ESL0790]|uniref:phosphoribosylglycinamide synthetase n=1 Tax=Bifidobacterium sp. ESL0790 TaxID=2983233 RepID=UPI0023F92ED7|nr:phosphoribosylglycinamide synthetase [Bifidobacterium sp. ESL0790]WEV73216.1 phosphoribosylglycinamide synthetase [Bifidobacterium sp. ESL0790]